MCCTLGFFSRFIYSAVLIIFLLGIASVILGINVARNSVVTKNKLIALFYLISLGAYIITRFAGLPPIFISPDNSFKLDVLDVILYLSMIVNSVYFGIIGFSKKKK